jgi:hypothetical protein
MSTPLKSGIWRKEGLAVGETAAAQQQQQQQQQRQQQQ